MAATWKHVSYVGIYRCKWRIGGWLVPTQESVSARLPAGVWMIRGA